MAVVKQAVLVVALALGAAFVSASILMRNVGESRLQRFGKCSTEKNDKDFDLERFVDKNRTWYEIARVGNDFEDNSDCNKLQLTLKIDDGQHAQLNMAFTGHYINHTVGSFYPLATVNRTNLELLITIAFDWSDEVIEKLVILDTDFDNYAIMYTCKELEGGGVLPLKEEKAWVLGRKPILDDQIQDKVDEYLMSTSDDFPMFLYEINTECNSNC